MCYSSFPLSFPLSLYNCRKKGWSLNPKRPLEEERLGVASGGQSPLGSDLKLLVKLFELQSEIFTGGGSG